LNTGEQILNIKPFTALATCGTAVWNYYG